MKIKFTESSAVFSPSRKYRYTLKRVWDSVNEGFQFGCKMLTAFIRTIFLVKHFFIKLITACTIADLVKPFLFCLISTCSTAIWRPIAMLFSRVFVSAIKADKLGLNFHDCKYNQNLQNPVLSFLQNFAFIFRLKFNDFCKFIISELQTAFFGVQTNLKFFYRVDMKLIFLDKKLILAFLTVVFASYYITNCTNINIVNAFCVMSFLKSAVLTFIIYNLLYTVLPKCKVDIKLIFLGVKVDINPENFARTLMGIWVIPVALKGISAILAFKTKH